VLVLSVHTKDIFACHNPTNTAPPAEKWTTGEWVSWLDQLNQPSTSRPFGQDPPPHQVMLPNWRTAAGTPGGSSLGASSSSSMTIQLTQPPQAPQTPHHQGSPNPLSHNESCVPEYLCSHRSPVFEPVAPGGNLMPAQTPNHRGAPAPTPAPMPQVNTPGR
jgi:hypothetical protein